MAVNLNSPEWGIIFNYCRWNFVPVRTEVVKVDGSGQRDLFTPFQKVTDVVQVIEDGETYTPEELAELEYSKSGIIRKPKRKRWTSKLNGVSLGLKVGYDLEEIPEVVLISELIAKRMNQDSRIKAQSVNGAAVTYMDAQGILLQEEMALLDKYRLTFEV